MRKHKNTYFKKKIKAKIFLGEETLFVLQSVAEDLQQKIFFLTVVFRQIIIEGITHNATAYSSGGGCAGEHPAVQGGGGGAGHQLPALQAAHAAAPQHPLHPPPRPRAPPRHVGAPREVRRHRPGHRIPRRHRHVLRQVRRMQKRLEFIIRDGRL